MPMPIVNNITRVQSTLPDHCQLIAVSKTKPVEVLMQAYDAGVRDFGENKAQEMTEKYEQMPQDIRWHMIGHLQRNKVKYLAPFVHLIHSVDSLRLLKEIEKQGKKIERKIDCLLQLHIAQEEEKFGLSEEELWDLLQGPDLPNMQFVQIKGLMGMATFTDNDEQKQREFRHLKSLFDQVKETPKLPTSVSMQTLSMGMSGDYRIALEEGSTMVRIGTTIFGAKDTH